MKLYYRLSLPVILVTLSALFASVPLSNEKSQLEISTPAQIKADFDFLPCKNEDRLRGAKALFEKMGAQNSDISIEAYKNVENLVVRKQGTSQEKIVVAAHYDKATEGCGAIDNWSGIVLVAHLYRSLKDVPSRKTILFVAFGKEEQGLIGSRAMSTAITKDNVAQYCAMINIDSVGMGAPQIADNLSSKKLSRWIADLPGDMKIGHTNIPEAKADSISFLDQNIPAVTILGLTNRWRSILHTRNDQPTEVNPDSVYLAYRLVLAITISLDNLSCAENR